MASRWPFSLAASVIPKSWSHLSEFVCRQQPRFHRREPGRSTCRSSSQSSSPQSSVEVASEELKGRLAVPLQRLRWPLAWREERPVLNLGLVVVVHDLVSDWLVVHIVLAGPGPRPLFSSRLAGSTPEAGGPTSIMVIGIR